MTPARTQATPAGGRRMDLRLLARAGEELERRRREEEELVDGIADELIAAGDLANIALASKLTGVSRSTLYRRIEVRRAGKPVAAAK